MTRAELAELAGPKFLLCTPGWLRGSVYGLGAVALVGGGALALSGFHAEPRYPNQKNIFYFCHLSLLKRLYLFSAKHTIYINIFY